MMVLADTNVWCDFFRQGDELLGKMLEFQFLAIHPLVIGELAVGNLPRRTGTLDDLRSLPMVKGATDMETHYLLETHRLYGSGLQWNDVWILASVIAAPDTLLWTRDVRLAKAAAKFNVAYAA